MAFNSLRAVKILPIFLSFELFFSLNTLQPVYAQSILHTEETQEKVIQTRVNFQPPNNEKPNGSMPGSSRDGLKLLVPIYLQETASGKTKPVAFGLTTKAKPLFFIKITNPDLREVDFILIDQETQEFIYQTTIDLDETSGEIGIHLPDDAPSLEVGKTYTISFQASGSFVATRPFAIGFIKRVEINPEIISQLENASLLEKAVLYAENGIWFDTLEILDELKRSQSENETFVTEWKELLKSVDPVNNNATKSGMIEQ